MFPSYFYLDRAIAVAVAAGCVIGATTQGQESTPASSASLEALAADVEAGRRATPLIGEPTTDGHTVVTFLARRIAGRAPRIVSDVTGWGEHVDGTFDSTVGRMTRVGRGDWYSLRARVAPRARIEYLIAYGRADYRLDPYNSRQVGPPPASEFVTPGYRPPQELVDPPESPAGLLTETIVESRALGRSCPVIVYTPSGGRNGRDDPVAVFLDSRAGQMSRVLDWLIAHQVIAPLVAVFVETSPPGTERPDGTALRTFLNEELPPWLTARYAVTRSADKRAVIAISYGAKDALDAALGPVDAFGRLGLLIPGRRISRSDIDAIAGRRDRPLRVAILAGQYDQANVATARSVRDALVAAGHLVDYTEVPEGHSPRTWLNHLRKVLVSLFDPALTGDPGER